MRLQDGDTTGFAEDLMAINRLARRLAEQVTLIDWLVGDAAETIACQVERIGASSGKFSAAQSKALADDLAALGDFRTTSACLNIGERYMMLDCLQALATLPDDRAAALFRDVTKSNEDWPVDFVPLAYRLIPIPWERTARVVNHVEDGALAAMSQPSYALKLAAIQEWDRQFNELRDVNPVSAVTSGQWLLSLMALGSRDKFLNDDYDIRAQSRLTQIALALAAFKTEHGAYPATLDELSPGELAKVPLDPFVERPFIYSPTAAGFTLYSVGPNMTDDGGKRDKSCDDIVASVP
jgi:hypothetical protein